MTRQFYKFMKRMGLNHTSPIHTNVKSFLNLKKSYEKMMNHNWRRRKKITIYQP